MRRAGVIAALGAQPGMFGGVVTAARAFAGGGATDGRFSPCLRPSPSLQIAAGSRSREHMTSPTYSPRYSRRPTVHDLPVHRRQSLLKVGELRVSTHTDEEEPMTFSERPLSRRKALIGAGVGGGVLAAPGVCPLPCHQGRGHHGRLGQPAQLGLDRLRRVGTHEGQSVRFDLRTVCLHSGRTTGGHPPGSDGGIRRPGERSTQRTSQHRLSARREPELHPAGSNAFHGQPYQGPRTLTSVSATMRQLSRRESLAALAGAHRWHY